MQVYVIQESGHTIVSTHDEFIQKTNNLRQIGWDCMTHSRHGFMYIQSQYLLVVDGALRNRDFETTYREFMKWITRLAKRVSVDDVLVRVYDENKSSLVNDCGERFLAMYELPSWARGDGHSNWTEYMMWVCSEDEAMPHKLYDYLQRGKE